MYAPEPFAWNDQAALWHALDRDSFGLLATGGPVDEAPMVSHLPFLLDPAGGRLLCHVARANPHWRSVGDGIPARCVFSGAHAYVSPTWYQRPDRAVPTWNYVAIHAVGTARAVEDRDWLADLMVRLTERHERPAGWRPDRLPAAMHRSMLGAIVGIEVVVTRLEGKRKLSQNRSPADRMNVTASLSDSEWPGDVALANEMKSEQGQQR